MTTEMITLKLDNAFLKEIDNIVDKNNYHNRTEFIRNALREKVDNEKMKVALEEISKLRGSSKKKITDEEYEKARHDVFWELYNESKKNSGK